MSTYRLPLRLPYRGASTIEDSDGSTVAECSDGITAQRLINVINAALNWWHVGASETTNEYVRLQVMSDLIVAIDQLHKGDL